MLSKVIHCPQIRCNCIFGQILLSQIFFKCLFCLHKKTPPLYYFCENIALILYRRCIHFSYYEKIGEEVFCIDEEIPYNIPDTWTWMRLENCCVKEIRRGKFPKYTENSNVLVFAQKCNTKHNSIDVSLAQYLDETVLKRYPDDEYMQDGDTVINSTGTGTLGRVGIYRNTDNTKGFSIVPDSHVTVIRSFSCINSRYLYAFMKAHQSELEKKGEGSTNQKELKPLTLKEMLIAIPPLSEQKRIDKSINIALSHFAVIEESLN